MYLGYFGFDSTPFAVTPDPAFLYLSESHREALAHLLYGAGEQGGFVALIGEVGTGKTTLIRAVVENNTPNLDIALCWNPHLDTTEFVGTICDELGVDYDPARDTTLKTLVDRLNAHLLSAHAANRRTVLIIDEAQNLSRDVLEQLRLLTNLETHKDKLLRVILVGQPELSDLLARHDLRQLAQRITARFVLKPLGVAETRAYVRHRLERANGPQHLFSRSALVLLRALTRGVPRLINVVCERALMGAYAHGRTYVGPWTVARAAIEALPARARRDRGARWWRLALPTGAVAVAAIIVGLAWLPDIPLTSAAEWMHSGPADAASPASTAVQDKQSKTAGPILAVNDASDDPDGHTVTDEAATAGAAGGTETDTPGDQDRQKAADSARDSSDHAAHANKAGDSSKNDHASDARSDTGPDDKSSDQHTTNHKSQSAADQGASDQSAPDANRDKSSQQAIPNGDADMNQLLRLWGVFGARVRAGCSDLRVGDLRCLADEGTFAVLKRYNRPALLTLDRDGKQQNVLLSHFNKNTVTLVGGDGTRDVDRAHLLELWTGRFQVVWRADAGVRLIQPGSVGGAVVWLRRRLLQVDGKNPDSQVGQPSPTYDQALGERLKAFQKSRGLKPDGIAGPRTQMMLNGAVPSPGAPSLRPNKDDSDQ